MAALVGLQHMQQQGHLSTRAELTTISRELDYSGSAFLRRWMEFLEQHADLRYPSLADVSGA